MKQLLLTAFASILFSLLLNAQPCTPSGDETTFGTGNIWIGYVYDNIDLTGYSGYINEGNTGSADFDQSFGGDNVSYATNGCPVNTNTFSVRYKLTKNFAAGTYMFTVGGDDGYRLSLDGGLTWSIDKWFDQGYASTSYTVTLSGNHDLVLEYYENTGGNRISFTVGVACNGTEDTNIYGSGNIWNGYVYDGTNFNFYAGMVHEGTSGSPDFDQSFGGDNVLYATSGCTVQTETFSVRYRLNKLFTYGTYRFVVGADDGYRLSTDGGATWLIDNWGDHGYTTSSATVDLSGAHDLILDFYENGGGNRISFTMETLTILPVRMLSFTGKENNNTVLLNWLVTADSDPKNFEIQRSADGITYAAIASIKGTEGIHTANNIAYNYTDKSLPASRIYYRIKITDSNGKITYSDIVSIYSGSFKNEIKIFPTPATNNTLYLQTGKKIAGAGIVINDISGRTISKTSIGNIAAGETIHILSNTNRLAKGLYIVSIMEAGECIYTQRVVIQ